MLTTTETSGPVRQPLAQQPTLRVLFSSNNVVDTVVPIDKKGLLLGRGDHLTGSLGWFNDLRMSRRHARIELMPHHAGREANQQEVRIYDERSTQGTFVNGNRVAMAELRDGDILRLGNTLLIFRYDADRHIDADVPSLLGEARCIRELRHRLVQVARGDAPVLVLGEVGAGKEVVARALHQQSGRSSGPFVAVNCAAISESLAESELFGYRPKTFTGADKDGRAGYFQEAHHGTLFLDEVGELSATLQAKLLRVLAEGEVLRVGAQKAEQISVRLLAATNRDLEHLVRQGRFRADLYSRLRGAVLTVPPLRDRREDILRLFLHALASCNARKNPQMTPRLCEALLLHFWPYNVRDLFQLARTLQPQLDIDDFLDLPMVAEWITLSTDQAPAPPTQRRAKKTLSPQSLAADRDPSELDPRSELGPRCNRDTLLRLLEEHDWNLSALSRLLQRSRKQLHRWMADHGIVRPSP